MKVKLALVLFLWVSLITNYSHASESIQIDSIIDGDTIKLSTGQSVRFLQIDTPEIRGNECYAQEARKILARLLTQDGSRTLSYDPGLDKVDLHGRLLRYLFIGKTNINLKLVEMGAATPWFFNRKLGKYSNELMDAVYKARSKKLGLWSACPGTKLNVYGPLTTIYPPAKNASSTNTSRLCDPNYEGCVPKFPPDLDCTDIRKLGLAPVRIIGRDVHQLDSDGDGIGCDK